ncbi:MAG: lipocalin family protein, partial [Wenzhouxiangellaceae bacterium]
MILTVLSVFGFRAGHAQAPLELVEHVDLERYQGLWHEVARLPNRFQRQCVGEVTARYRLQDNGRIEVINRCRLADGSRQEARGEARQPQPSRPAALEVRFAPRWLGWLSMVWGDYQIMQLSDDYDWVMIGAPSRQYLWILARRPSM